MTVKATKKRGLGRGLDALLSDLNVSKVAASEGVSQADAQAGDDSFRHLPIEFLQRGQYQPRRDMDPVALEELAKSIRSQGIIQPIIVRPIASGNYEIIAGERRWRAAQMADMAEVPVIVRDIPDEATVVVALIENIQREELNAIEEAIAFHRLLNEFSLTHQQVADAVGKSRSTVSNLLRLLELPEFVKTLLENGDIEMGHARAILALNSPQQQEVAARTVAAKNFSVREAEAFVRKLQTPSKKSSTSQPDTDILRLEKELSERLGAKVNISHTAKGKGKVIIGYHSLDELDGILSVIRGAKRRA